MKLYYKIIISLPIIFSQIIAVIFIGIGAYYFSIGTIGLLSGHMGTEAAPGIKMLHALDLFLFSFLFMIFSLGFSQLFLPKCKLSTILDEITPDWLHVKNFTELKFILWETLLTTMLVIFTEQIFKNIENINWQMLLIPVSIFLISLSIFFIRKGGKDVKQLKLD